MTIRDIDLNLPKALRILLTERYVTRTGEQLGRSQWHVRNDRNKKHAWLRQQVKSIYRKIRSGQTRHDPGLLPIAG